MNTHYQAVTEFMTTAGQSVNTHLTLQTSKSAILRVNLIKEEIDELRDALNTDDIVEIIDALGDILVVTYGAYATYGIPSYLPTVSMESSVTGSPVLKTHGYSTNLIRLLNNQVDVFDIATSLDNVDNMVSALNVILKTVYNASIDMNINIERAFAIICESNMSKFCLTEDDVVKSSADLVIQGKVDSVDELTFKIVGDYYVVIRKKDGKILKGRFFHEPDFSSIL